MNWFQRWLADAIIHISRQQILVLRKLDALIEASPKVSAEQLKELKEQSTQLTAKTDSLVQAIEKNKT